MSWRSRQRRATNRRIKAFYREMLASVTALTDDATHEPYNHRGYRITGRWIDPVTDKPVPRLGYEYDGIGWIPHIS